jgi:hypothetical protein
MANAYINASFMGAEVVGLQFESKLGKKCKTLSEKITKAKWLESCIKW